MFDLLCSDVFQKALLGGTAAAVMAALVGYFLVLRVQAFAAEAFIGHLLCRRDGRLPARPVASRRDDRLLPAFGPEPGRPGRAGAGPQRGDRHGAQLRAGPRGPVSQHLHAIERIARERRGVDPVRLHSQRAARRHLPDARLRSGSPW